ncbi:MAG TPA: M20/M25/M40 family metallo-hydrolase [Blastocatellia bacterium]|nr:M20/M25/M40 family metallo-hydrolase [Blastocatellia bacterium]
MHNSAADQDISYIAPDFASSPEILRGFSLIDSGTIAGSDAEVVRICEIPAPPFKEHARAAYVRRRMEQIGLAVSQDRIGNVFAARPGRAKSQPIIVSAHLDTVFPEDTDVRVRREGARLWAPGISDNACGVASLLALAEVLQHANITTDGPVYFVGTVGEEGEGNLRGVRHLFTEGEFKAGAGAFVSLDGPGLERITNRALGSRRYKVTIEGPGGHSWADFGIVNPVHALGRAIAKFAAYQPPISPRTSFNVGVIEGGSSVNAIPDRASMLVDIRSMSKYEIDKLEAHLRRSVDGAIREETAQRSFSGTGLTLSLEMIGDRPSGETPVHSPLVQAALECSRALGIEPRLDCSSTDSNIPISLGIPAITIGVGGLSGNCHSLTEWYEPTGRELGMKRLLILTLALAGLAF